MATIRLRWYIDNLATVMASYDTLKFERSTAGIGGPYTEITAVATRLTLQTGTVIYEFVDPSGNAAYYYRAVYSDSGAVNPDDAQAGFLGTAETGLYCTVQDMRDEGFLVASFSDALVLGRIRLASHYIERMTGRWFEVREREFYIDGEGTPCLRMPQPIIKISEMAAVESRATYTEIALTFSDWLIYNRHLTQQLTKPDDRALPRIETGVVRDAWGARESSAVVYEAGYDFLLGRQNIRVKGLFGYTELQPDDSVGETTQGSQIPLSYGSAPLAIQRACMLLVARDLSLLSDAAGRRGRMHGHRVEQEKTRDQSYKMTSLATLGATGAWTGDPEIDGILAMYVAPSRSGFAAVAV